MTKDSVDNFALTIAGTAIGTAVITVMALFTPDLKNSIGPALTVLIWLLFIVTAISLCFVFIHYVGILESGKKAKGTREREAYDHLRATLSEGGFSAGLYVRRLKSFLDAVDHFFGDADKDGHNLISRAIGLKSLAPLWTAPSFDRCLLLALVYPVATIFVIWAVSGHVGRAEAALGLKINFPLWRRVLAILLVVTISFSSWKIITTERRRSIWFVFTVTFIGLGALMFAAPVSITVAMVFAAAVAFAGLGLGTGAGAGAVAAAVIFPVGGIGAFIFIRAVIFTGTGAFASADGIAGVGALIFTFVGFVAIVVVQRYSLTRGWFGTFLSIYIPLMIVLVLIAAWFMTPLKEQKFSDPLLLFLGLLTLLNAPFDWLSLGLTRLLLRRGIELKSWWPYGLAIVDAAAAVVVIAVLACVMVSGVQAFDMLTVGGGGKAVLPLAPLFEGIARHPDAPEFWWIYALLLSTMIPSLVNLVIGGASLFRGIPGISTLILHHMPAGKAVSSIDRSWMAGFLTLQWFFGAALGIGAQAALVWLFFGRILPWLGGDMLAIARAVESLNLPAGLWRIFA